VEAQIVLGEADQFAKLIEPDKHVAGTDRHPIASPASALPPGGSVYCAGERVSAVVEYLEPAGLVAVFFIVLIEQIGLPLPSYPLLIVASAWPMQHGASGSIGCG